MKLMEQFPRDLTQNAVTAPVFAGGATATVPDDSLTNANIPSHAFRGNVTFTADWTVPNLPAGNPYVVAPGARLNGKTIAAVAYQNVNYHLRVDKDAVATFETVNVQDKFVFKLNGGRLVATGAVNMWQNDCGQYLESNVGTVEANAIIKNAPSHKQGRKDIIKIDSAMALDLNILGFIDPEITVNVIKDGALIEKKIGRASCRERV